MALRRGIVGRILAHLVVIVAVIAALLPLYWLVVTSVIPWQRVMAYPPELIPTEFVSFNWKWALSKIPLPFRNSLIIATAVTAISIAAGLTSGYAFARFRIKGGPTLLFWILSLRFLPGIVPVVAFYIMFERFGLLDTPFAVIIAHLIIDIPFAVWMIKGFIEEVPPDMEEAALVDGCSRLQVITKIVLPVIAPGVAVTAFFCFVWSWNEFMFALILTESKAYTMPVTIAGFRGAGIIWGAASAAALVATLPSLVLAILFRKYLVRVFTYGVIKA